VIVIDGEGGLAEIKSRLKRIKVLGNKKNIMI
jgi:hypothetical protein